MNEVLIVSIGFSPNVGGIETHFDDLTRSLDKRNWKVWVLTYMPITSNLKATWHENRGKNVEVLRIPWFRNLFYKLVGNPILEFLYLVPGLFFALPIFLIIKGHEIKTIDSHGLIAGFVSVFWGKIFGKRVITTTHSIYNFPSKGLYRSFSFWIFNNSDHVLTLSKQSKKEIEKLGIYKDKITTFKYWIDLNVFKKVKGARKTLKLNTNFTVLFVGRLVQEKGVVELLKAATMWNSTINLLVVGVGPLEKNVVQTAKMHKNILYCGAIKQKELPKYYSAADVLVVPSVHEEGFGRVILESLACGTPVIGSDRGAIPEAMDDTVGRLIDITLENIKHTVEYFFKNSVKLDELSKKCRPFAEKRYSEKNAETIINSYEKEN